MRTFSYEGRDYPYIMTAGDWHTLLHQHRWRDYELRRAYVEAIGFSIITNECARTLASFLRGLKTDKILDAGCGSGYITNALQVLGVSGITPVDACTGKYWSTTSGDSFAGHRNPLVELVVGDAVEYAPYADVIIISWPDMENPFGERILRTAQPGTVIVHLGEELGCTGTPAFDEALHDSSKCVPFEELNDELQRTHVRFPGLHDYWFVTKKIA